MTRRIITNNDNIKRFVFAGRAVFTLVSAATGDRFTYKVGKAKGKGVFWVSLRTGKDEKWTFFGVLRKDGTFFFSQKSPMESDDIEVAAFDWFIRHLLASDNKLDQADFWHEGRCARCGRELTDPESIQRGMGPTCWSKS